MLLFYLFVVLNLNTNIINYFSQDFYSHTGQWANMWSGNIPHAVPFQYLDLNNKEFTIDQVQEWVEKNGCIQGRFRFFETYARNSEFYQKIAQPLLSMRTVGSIDVERLAKPLKHKLLTKERNCLRDDKGIILFCAGQNLRQLMKAKMALNKNMH